MNNKDKKGVYFDAINKKKYELVYDNGKLISQAEVPLGSDSEGNDHLEYDSDKPPF